MSCTPSRASFAEAAPLLETLDAALSRLYAYEMDCHRNHVTAQGRAIAEIQAMGGDATLPRRKLRGTILALAQDDRESYLEVIEEVDALVQVARAQRVQAIERGAEEVEGPLREGLTDALKTGDFISAHFLLMASRETSFQDASTPATSPFQDSRKIALLKEVLAQIESMVERAKNTDSTSRRPGRTWPTPNVSPKRRTMRRPWSGDAGRITY